MKRFIFLLAVVAFPQLAAPQAPSSVPTEAGRPFMATFTLKDYPGDTQTWAFVQDQRGVIYAGNTPGVLEYDGASWRMIPTTNNSFVRSLAIDDSGRIYYGAQGDFGYLAPDAAGQLHQVSLLHHIPEAQRNFNYVWTTLVTDDGVYFQTREHLFRFIEEDTTWNVKIWQPKSSFDYAFWFGGNYYVHQGGIGFSQMINDSLHVVPGGEQFASDRAQVMLPADDSNGRSGNFLLGTFNRGFFLFEGQSFRPFKTEADDYLRNSTLYDAAILTDGAVALATTGGGVVIIERDGRLRRYLNSGNGLVSNPVTSIFVDRSGALWVGPENGIQIIETPAPLSKYAAVDGLDGGVSILIRYHGVLYAGTSIGPYYLEAQNSRFQAVAGLLPGNKQTFGFTIFEDKLLVASGTGLYEIVGNRAQIIKRTIGLKFSPNVLHRSQSDSSLLFCGGLDGLYAMRFDRGRNQWKDEGIIADIHEYVSSIIEPEPGELWLGTNAVGVLRMTYESAALQNAKAARFGVAEGLTAGGVTVRKVMGKPAFITNAGIYRFEDEKNAFRSDSMLQVVSLGTSPTSYSGVTEDHDGNLWVNLGAETAMMRKQPDGSFQTEKLAFQRFADTPTAFIYPEKDGVVWFGTNESLIRYDPSIQKNYAAPFTTLIRRVFVGEDSLLYGGAPIETSSVETSRRDVSTLAYSQNTLRFEFAAPTYDNPRETRYQFMLEGFDEHWSVWHRNTQKEYTNLPSRDYRFRVRAKNIYQHESSEAVYEFKILPPWYRTAWAYLFYLLAAGGFVFSLIRIRTRQLEASHRELEKTVEERTQEIQQRMQELAVINSVQEGLVRELDIQALYDLVGDRIRDIFDAQVVIISTFDHEAGTETLVYNIEKGKRVYTDPRPIDKVRRHLIDKRETILINENLLEAVAEEFGIEKPKPVPGTEMPKSALWVPLVVGETVRGYVSLQNIDREHAFSDSDVRLLTTLANSMSVALENARLFDETNRLLKETETRAAELAIINKVGEGLAQQLDFQGIIDLVGDKIVEVFKAQVVSVSLFDPKTQTIHHRYVLERGERFYFDQPQACDPDRLEIIQTRKPLVFGTSQEMVAHSGEGVIAGDMPKSYMGVPIILGQEATGVITVQDLDHEHAFSDTDVRLLATLASNMGVALENARLFDETNRLLKDTEQRNAELAIINSVGEAMAKQLDVQTVTGIVGDKVREIFKAEAAEILLLDADTNVINVPYSYYRGHQQVESFPLGEGLTSKILKSRKPITHGTLREARELGAIILTEEEATESYMGVPIVVGEKALGVVSVQSYKQHAYDENSVRLLSTLSSNMGVAIENARLFDETNRLLKATEQRNAELAVINGVQEDLVRELDMQAIYELVGNRLTTLFDIQVVIIRTFDHDAGLEHWQFAFEKGERLHSAPRPFNWANRRLIQTRQPMLINENYVETAQKFGGKGVTVGEPPKSAVFMPLLVGDTVKGSISLQNVDRENAFTESDVRLLSTLANSMSVALENARLFHETNRLLADTKQRAAELATVNSISEALASQLKQDDLIQLVGEQIRQVFRANIVYVALLDKATNMIHFPYSFGEDAAPLAFGEGLTSQIIKTGKPLLINEDVDASYTKLGIADTGAPAESYLGVPIPVGNEVIGVISAQSSEQTNRFTENDLRLLNTIAANVGVALHNARLFEETQEARAAAEEANEAKSSFLSTVSHELRTPLTSVLGFAKIIKKRLEEKIFPLLQTEDNKIKRTVDQIAENLNVVVAEGERLTTLINNVLDLAKIEAGKIEWHMEALSVPEIIERATAATSSLFDNSGLKLKKEVQAGLPEITGDADKLIQVVINLISNAVKFTNKGSVTCRAKQSNGEIVVSIIDTGMGIAPEDQPKVFEKFKQVGDTLTNKPKGTGLGLTISKEIIEHHGGRIWVESEIGVGSTFSFALPLKSQSERKGEMAHVDFAALMAQLKQRVQTTTIKSKNSKPSILVVDDEASIRELLNQELQDAGYQVRVAANGREALEQVRREHPDLVILDVMMPEMNGFDVAAVLKNDPATMDIPILILSIVQDRERGFRLGVDRYLTKPIDTEALFREVGSLLQQGKSHRKVMVVDEDASTVKTLAEVLQARGYHVVEANGPELVQKAVSEKPDIIILNSMLSGKQELVKSLRFEKGLEDVLFLVYQ